MSDQLTFDLDAGRAARDAAIEAVNDPPWRAFADRALATVCRERQTLTCEDVWRELDRMGVPRPGEQRAMGPVMQDAMRAGLIVPSSVTSSANPRRHAGLTRVFEVAR